MVSLEPLGGTQACGWRILSLPYMRVYPSTRSEDVIWVTSYDEKITVGWQGERFPSTLRKSAKDGKLPGQSHLKELALNFEESCLRGMDKVEKETAVGSKCGRG